ncbi:MAG: LarC family nickel insertion protein, partial [Actinomycetota bacterium]
PAVLALVAEAGLPARGGPVEVELATPTGTALLAEHVTAWGPMPALTVERVGIGAGTRELPDRPNVLRLIVGEPVTAVSAGLDEGVEDLLIEATIDDMNPELYPLVLERLTDAGAIDAWVTPVIGKHGRPAQILSVLAPPGLIELVRETLVNETSTLGVRATTVRRWMLRRTFIEVEVLGEVVRVKVGLREGVVVNLAPEYADCAAVAEATSQPIKEIYRLAMAAASARDLLGPFPPIG